VEPDPAGADRELERPAAVREVGEQVRDRVDLSALELLGLGVVVASRDRLIEVAVVVHVSEPTATTRGLADEGRPAVATDPVHDPARLEHPAGNPDAAVLVRDASRDRRDRQTDLARAGW